MNINGESSIRRDKIRGCLAGGAAGDALGYAIEFKSEEQIFSEYGEKGIQEYAIDRISGKAHISDDTQMTLFTANGILFGITRRKMYGLNGYPRHYVAMAYQDWLVTQKMPYDVFIKDSIAKERCVSWLSYVPSMYKLRAPGVTCMNALEKRGRDEDYPESYLENPINSSKGCGGVMRAAPVALVSDTGISVDEIDMEAAEISAVTHGHSLGYMTSSVLAHVIRCVVYPEKEMSLKEIVLDARDTVAELFKNDEHIGELTGIINRALELSENECDDLENIHILGEGWVAEETLAIALYCALRYQNDFSAGITASVNHKGDSDSTGAVTGNILGAYLGYNLIDEKWKKRLELSDIILELADDMYRGCKKEDTDPYEDSEWKDKYVKIQHD